MIRTLTLAATVAMAFAAIPAHAASNAQSTCKARSNAMLGALAKHDYKQARAHFDSTMSGQFDVAKIKSFWTQLNTEAGAYKSHNTPSVGSEDKYTVVTTKMKFAKADINATVACDGKGNIAGLRFLPVGAGK